MADEIRKERRASPPSSSLSRKASPQVYRPDTSGKACALVPAGHPVTPPRTKPPAPARLTRAAGWVQGCQPRDPAPIVPLSPDLGVTTGRLPGPGWRTRSACRVANARAGGQARRKHSTLGTGAKVSGGGTTPWGSGSRAGPPRPHGRWGVSPPPPRASRTSLPPARRGASTPHARRCTLTQTPHPPPRHAHAPTAREYTHTHAHTTHTHPRAAQPAPERPTP